MTRDSGPLVVGHAVGVWLEQTQTWLYNQIRHLPDPIACHVFCETTQNLDQFPIANLEVCGPRRGLRALGSRLAARLDRPVPVLELEEALRRVRVQVLHSHFGSAGWHNSRLANRLGLGHVVTFYGLDVSYLPRQGWASRYPELFRRVDRVLCEGPHMARCIEALGCPPEKLRVHRLGVPVGEIEFAPRSWSPGEPLRVLVAASFREKKGIPDGLEALGRLRHELDFRITLIGDAAPDPASLHEKRRILDAIERHGLGPRTTLLGYQPHARLFEEAYRHHVYLSPSRTAESGDTEGGAPVSLIEMAATGMAIVSTRHCDVPEVIVDGETGLLADERDVPGLVAALRRLAERPQAWRPMLEAGRRRVECLFDARRQAVSLAAVYRELR